MNFPSTVRPQRNIVLLQLYLSNKPLIRMRNPPLLRYAYFMTRTQTDSATNKRRYTSACLSWLTSLTNQMVQRTDIKHDSVCFEPRSQRV